MSKWNTDMYAAPKDRPILAWCKHDADPYHEGNGRLTTYGAHCEGLSHVEDGPHVVVWGGEWIDTDEYGGVVGSIPDWWFRFGSGDEEVANPIAWKNIEEPTP